MNDQFGNPQQPYQAQPAAPAAVCTNCGTPFADGQSFCTNCGAARPAPQAAPQSAFCTKCGAPLQPGQSFCTSCGQPVNAAAANPAINQFNANIAPKKKSKLPIVLGVIAAIVVLIIIISSVGGDSGNSGSSGNSGYVSNGGDSYGGGAVATSPNSGDSYYESLAVGYYTSIGYMDDGEIKALPTAWAKLTLDSDGTGKLTYDGKTMRFTWAYSKTTDGNHYYTMAISDGGGTAFVLLDDYLVMQVGELQLIFE